jgi:hypothetical protein
MQSLRRQIKRGNACMCFNRFTNEVYVSKKKGSPSFKNLNGEMVKSFDMDMKHYRSIQHEQSYMKEVTNLIIK